MRASLLLHPAINKSAWQRFVQTFPNYPQSLPRTGYVGNGRIERSFRTDEEEFYQVEDLADLGGLEQALLAWNRAYEAAPPIKPWATIPQTSSITTGSILMQRERRSCPISPDPVHSIVVRKPI